MNRRSFLISSLAVGAAGVLAACSTSTTDGAATAPHDDSPVDPDAFPVTIEHAFGTTTIDERPQRVVALGSSDADNVLSLGVVPIGVPKVSWGGNDRGSTPWFDAKLEELGGSAPAQVDDSDSVPIDDIAALGPDLIMVTNYGMTKSDYGKLAKIANVVAYPGDAWTTPWQQSLQLNGQALGRATLAAELQRAAEKVLSEVQQNNPGLAGTSFIWAAMSATDLSSIPFYTPQDGRPMLLTQVGMTNAPIIEELSKDGQFWGTVSAERAAELDSDVLITYANTDEEARTIFGDKLISQIPAVAAGHAFAAVDKTDALSGTVASPLAIPYAAEHFFPNVAAAVSSTVIR